MPPLAALARSAEPGASVAQRSYGFEESWLTAAAEAKRGAAPAYHLLLLLMLLLLLRGQPALGGCAVCSRTRGGGAAAAAAAAVAATYGTSAGGGSGSSGGDAHSANSSGGSGGGGGDSVSSRGGGGAPALLSPGLEARLRQLHARCGAMEAQLAGSGGDAPDGGGGGGGGGAGPPSLREVGREYSRLRPLAAAYDKLQAVRQEASCPVAAPLAPVVAWSYGRTSRFTLSLSHSMTLSDLASLARDPDPAVRALAAEESEALRQQAAALSRQVLLALLPRDPREGRPVLLELRAGAGGDEAALFAGELLGMYQRFAQPNLSHHTVMDTRPDPPTRLSYCLPYAVRQGRVTDHRIHLTLHDLPGVLAGGEALGRLVEALRAAREDAALAALAEEAEAEAKEGGRGVKRA
ncbi:Peptide chain release factor 1 [Tetrabaena socialis]|uniref:Peptide chain release factor 1 n=1 Tax=Tetrabaena socialis TaxID=47790 RepID=A0A2J7ZS43_9CHLO|nr:Peptide chain release factor 1 [Tetrabaena socialis]|eukprot:PNH03092.1 Peptide chain release factor 1 [Tetrabaena socialis]